MARTLTLPQVQQQLNDLGTALARLQKGVDQMVEEQNPTQPVMLTEEQWLAKQKADAKPADEGISSKSSTTKSTATS